MFWETRCSFLQGEMLFGALITGERHCLKSFTSSSLDSSRIKTPDSAELHTTQPEGSHKECLPLAEVWSMRQPLPRWSLYPSGLGGAVVLDNSVHALSVLSHCLRPHGLLPAELLSLSTGILQAKILEWVAISSSRESSPLRDWTCIS